MEIQHNNTEVTRVRPSPGARQRSLHFDYSTGDEQLSAAIGQSEHCEQELSYRCRKSRLLNTPGKRLFFIYLGSFYILAQNFLAGIEISKMRLFITQRRDDAFCTETKVPAARYEISR